MEPAVRITMAQQPNPYYQKPVRRKPVQLNLPGASITPASQPVDTYYRTNLIEPRESNDWLKAAGALAPFSKSLGLFMSSQADLDGSGGGRRSGSGTGGSWLGEDLDPSAIPTEEALGILSMSEEEVASDPRFKELGNRPDAIFDAMQNVGISLSDAAKEQIMETWSELYPQLTDPNSDHDINETVDGLWRSVMGNIKGHAAQKGAAANLEPLFANLKNSAIKGRTERRITENNDNLRVKLSEAFSGAAIDGSVNPGELNYLFEVAKAQFANYKETGGKNPQDLMFEALENTLSSLMVEDPSGEASRALIQAAESGLDPRGGPLAKPGTKNHKTLMAMADTIERKVETRSDKVYQEELRAKKQADLEFNAVSIQYAAGELSLADAEAAIRESMGNADFTDVEINSRMTLMVEAKENADNEPNPELYLKYVQKGEADDLDADDIYNSELSPAEQIQLHKLYIEGTTEDQRKQNKFRRDTLYAADVSDMGLSDLKQYPERIRGEIARKLLVFQKEFNTSIDLDDPDLAANRKQAVQAFKTENEGLLRNTVLGQMTTATADMKSSQNEWLHNLTGSDGDDPNNSALKAAGRKIYRETLEEAVKHANATFENREEIPGIIETYMGEREESMSQAFVIERAKLERRDAGARRSLGVGLAGDEESLPGEQFAWEGNRTEELSERTRELFIELKKRGTDPTHDVAGSFEAVRKLLGEDVDRDRKMLGSFVASGGRNYTKDGVRNLRTEKPGIIYTGTGAGRFTVETAKKHIALIDMATGLDANELLAGKLPVGVSSTDLNLALTRVFKDRSEYDIWHKEVDDAHEADDLEGMKNSKAGRLMRKLGIPDLIGDVPSAAVFMNLQAQLLGD